LPRSIRADLPEALEQVVLKTLEKDPNRRYDSAAAMATALAEMTTATANVAEVVTRHDSSLVTEYDKSVIGAARPEMASLMTMFDSGPGRTVLPPGASVFGQSLPPSAQDRIQVAYKGNTAQMVPLASGTVTIGRGPQNNITLVDPKASQRHAQITWDGVDYRVMDLNSRNGTYLGSTKLLPGIPEVWRRNQTLRIGDTWLRLIHASGDLQDGSVVRSTLGGAGSRTGGSLFTSPGAGLVAAAVTPQQPSVEPGESVTINISLLNQSPNVDHFSLSISGIPRSWIASLPPSVQLMPGEQKETAFSLLVPRTPQGRAGRHPLNLKVTSQKDPGQSVDVRLTLTVAAFSQFKTEIQTQRLREGQTGRLTISNYGNTQETFNVRFVDPAGELIFDPSQPQPQIGPGETALVLFHAKIGQPRWVGGEKLHAFTAQVSLPNAEAQTVHADLVTRAAIPIWVPPAVVLFCLLCLGSLFMIQPPLQPVPTLTLAASPVNSLGFSGTPDLGTAPLPVGLSQTSTSDAPQTQTLQAQQVQQTQTSQALTLTGQAQTQMGQAQQAQQTLTSQALTQTQVSQAQTLTSQAQPTHTSTSTLTPSPPPFNPLAQLRNSPYQLSSSQIVQLIDGKYEHGTPDNPDFVSVSLTDFVTLGDLNADGISEVVALISENSGGTGNFVYLTVYANVNGTLSFQKSIFVDDRPGLHELSIENNEIVLAATVHRLEDPLCCPTWDRILRYRYINGQLVLME
jgi:hypothetical protein